MTGAALAIMARAPLPGQTKTRLQPDLTSAQCASLSKAFIEDSVTMAASLPQYSTFLAVTPASAKAMFDDLIPAEVSLMVQKGQSLGQRMFHLMRNLEERGFSPVVLIGSDIPTLQPAILRQALDKLKRSDICLGPAHDGGYYLVGARHADERIFSRIRWGTPYVLEMTLAKAHKAGFTTALLKEYSDIDTIADLKRLTAEIERIRKTAGAYIPLQTERWINDNVICPI